MSLKDRLATALSQRPGLTQAGLATACGITRASVNAWVHGKTDLQVTLFQEAFDEISKKVMDKIAAGIAPDELAGLQAEALKRQPPA